MQVKVDPSFSATSMLSWHQQQQGRSASDADVNVRDLSSTCQQPKPDTDTTPSAVDSSARQSLVKLTSDASEKEAHSNDASLQSAEMDTPHSAETTAKLDSVKGSTLHALKKEKKRKKKQTLRLVEDICR